MKSFLFQDIIKQGISFVVLPIIDELCLFDKNWGKNEVEYLDKSFFDNNYSTRFVLSLKKSEVL